MQMVPNPSQQDQGQENTKNPTEFAYAGRAVFNKDLKLVGYLNTDEAKQAFWVKGQLKFLTVTGFIPQGNGNVSLDLMKLGKTIQPSLRGNQIRISVKLTGQGVIQENNTDLDLTKTKNLQMIENVLDKETQKQVQQVITKVQQEYKADIFGFGEAVHRKYPYQWKSLKKNWEEDFSQANVSVKVNLNVKRVGLTGPSLQLKENQIKK
jgi:spore germination protein KC